MNRVKLSIFTAIFIATAFTFSCSSGDDEGGGGGGSTKGSFTDARDGQTYGTVKIGNQTWMAKNLNFDADGSACYRNEESNCVTYGRLYKWEAAMTACPSGWHLPTKDEWDILTNSVGGRSVEAEHLRAASGWSVNNGQDTYGFAALPGGNGRSGSFSDVGNDGYWWTASEYASSDAYSKIIGGSGWFNNMKIYMFSVRCLKD
jgi:uncharacterized protein (TIGR02145 family)